VRARRRGEGGAALNAEQLRLLPEYFLDQDSHEEGIRQLHAAIADWVSDRAALA
jgi:hypothetical protein